MTALARLLIPYPRDLTMYPYPTTRLGVKPKEGAVCSNCTWTDVCGGGQVTAIPTATDVNCLLLEIDTVMVQQHHSGTRLRSTTNAYSSYYFVH